MKELKDAAKTMAVSALAVSLASAVADARCGPREPLDQGAITRCLELQPGRNFAEGLSVGAKELLQKWGFVVEAETISHPKFGTIKLQPETTADIRSQHVDRPNKEAGELESIRIIVQNKDNTVTFLDLYNLNGEIMHRLQKIQIPSPDTFKRK